MAREEELKEQAFEVEQKYERQFKEFLEELNGIKRDKKEMLRENERYEEELGKEREKGKELEKKLGSLQQRFD